MSLTKQYQKLLELGCGVVVIDNLCNANPESLRRVEELAGHDHDPKALYESDHRIRRCVDALTDGTLSDGGTGLFAELRSALLEGAHWHAPDHYYVLGDFDACLAAKKQVARDYGRNRRGFAAKQWRNLCAAGYFSADRAVREYAKHIWKIR